MPLRLGRCGLMPCSLEFLWDTACFSATCIHICIMLRMAFHPSYVAQIAKKTGFRRPVAFGITVFLVNVCGTLTFLSSGLLLASYLTKVRLLESDKINKL